MAIFYTDTASLGQLEAKDSAIITGSFKVTSASIDVFSIDQFQNTIISGSLVVNVDSIPDYLTVAQFEGNQNNYLELSVQNISSGISASTDIVAYADNGTPSSSFIDVGINSSNMAVGYSFGNANDGYVYNTGGNLYIGNNTAYYQPQVTEQSLFFFANASGSPDMAITGGRVGIGKTGSLQATLDVSGSAFITGSLRVSQGVTASLLGTSSFSLTASFALNAGGGSGAGFPYAGTALITGSIVLTSGSGFPTLLASETLTAGDFVNIFSGGVRRASNDDLTKQAHGFVSASYSATNPVIVFYSGLNTGLTGLTAGSRYFLGTTGGEVTTPPTATARLSQEIGVAISTNAILVNFGPAIIT